MSKTQEEYDRKGQEDGAKGTYDPPGGGFIESVLRRPAEDCSWEEKRQAYDDGHKNGEANRKK